MHLQYPFPYLSLLLWLTLVVGAPLPSSSFPNSARQQDGISSDNIPVKIYRVQSDNIENVKNFFSGRIVSEYHPESELLAIAPMPNLPNKQFESMDEEFRKLSQPN